MQFPCSTLPRPMLAAHLALLGTACICTIVAGPTGWVWFGIAAALTGVGVVWPLLTVAAIDVTSDPAVHSLDEGGTAVLDLNVRHRFPWPAVGLELVGPDPSTPLPLVRSGTRVRTVKMPGLKRGTFRFHDAALTCRFPLDLHQARRPVSLRTTLVVRPRRIEIGPVLPSAAATRGTAGTAGRAGNDTSGLRGYQRGDSPRQIAWGATARLGQLVARERTVPPVHRWQFQFDEAAFHDVSAKVFPAFERAIAALASLAAACVLARRPVEVVFDGSRRCIVDEAGLERLREDLAAVPRRPRPSVRLPADSDGVEPIVLTSASGRPISGGLRLRFADAEVAADGIIATDRQFADRLAALGITGPSHVQ